MRVSQALAFGHRDPEVELEGDDDRRGGSTAGVADPDETRPRKLLKNAPGIGANVRGPTIAESSAALTKSTQFIPDTLYTGLFDIREVFVHNCFQ